VQSARRDLPDDLGPTSAVCLSDDSSAEPRIGKHFLCSTETAVGRFRARISPQNALRKYVSRRPAQTLPVACVVPGRRDGSSRHPGTVSDSRNRSTRLRIARTRHLGTATRAIWKMAYLAWATALAPIVISFSRSVVGDQCFTDGGRASLGRKAARLCARANSG